MTHWKLTLSYDGTGFHGWQVQPGLVTIQGTLAAALHRMTGEDVLPQGSGRTDAGVHALAQVASFSLTANIPPANLQRALNSILPASIRVLSADPAPPAFHARHCAIRKTYEYRIFELRPASELRVAHSSRLHRDEWATSEARICPPFLAPFLWPCRWPLNLEAMQTAAHHLLGEHDFASFAASDPDRSSRELDAPPSTVRNITTAAFTRAPEALTFHISGSGFLHHMVRNIVGTLVEVGRGALVPEDILRILAARDRTQAGPTAPARGLFLTRVDYPEDTPHP